MTPENQKTLVDTFPNLYSLYNGSPQETCMCWGFECPDQWYPIIYELSERIQCFMNENNCTVKATQVKEKYGELRFYYDYSNLTDEQFNIIQNYVIDAERKVYQLNKIMNKMCFVQDNDGHWYKIPVHKREYFLDIIQGDLNTIEFENNRCLYPGNYMFDHIYVLKENKS